MSFDEFFHGDLYLTEVYREKHKIDIESKNQELWLQGLYIHSAVSVCVANALGKKKHKYIEEPIRLTPETEDEKEFRLKRERERFVEELKTKIAKTKKT
jgi:hypothetical protein